MSSGNAFKLNYLLAPLAPLYGLGASVRNLLFNWGILSSTEYQVPVISIGNLAVGGTGKTPHTEYLVRLLKDDYRVAVLSRGYKRSTKGFVLADENSTAQTIGDEAYQVKNKFPDLVVAVDGNRRRGIQNLLALPDGQKPEVILLDDAFQHRYVTPSLSILLTDYNRLFYKDYLLPYGRLREWSRGMHRADGIVVTKCPDTLRPIDFRIIESEMGLLPHQHLYFTRVEYGQLRPVFPSSLNRRIDNFFDSDNEALLVAGIASPELFIKEAEKRYCSVTPILFPDHHVFEKQDIRKISDAFARLKGTEKFVLVTEKDAARLSNNPFVPEEWKEVLFYLPITIEFCTESVLPFDDWVKNHIITFKRNNIFH
ncbi:tetraacyldisaccharide 4'-kinase [Bacteroidia bacterium]|nr:tetraacyldisaccharide 4'-kinase [Bacteroidia bacterium]